METPEKPIEEETIHDKIYRGLRKAQEKLFRETAARDGTLVISRNGQVMEVPAKELLTRLLQRQKEEQAQNKTDEQES